MAIMRDDGSTDWATLGRWVVRSAVAAFLFSVIWIAAALFIVKTTSWCPPPWSRVAEAGDQCMSPK